MILLPCCFQSSQCCPPLFLARRCVDCYSGYYRTSETGQSYCRPGYYCNSCQRKSCSYGKYSSSYRATSCASWRNCGPGSYSAKQGSSTSNRVCSSCPGGKYSSGSNWSGCKSWSTCSPGYYVTTNPSNTRNRGCRSVFRTTRLDGAAINICFLNFTHCPPPCTVPSFLSSCPSNTYQPYSGFTRTYCYDVRKCGKGQYQSRGPTSTSNRVVSEVGG